MHSYPCEKIRSKKSQKPITQKSGPVDNRPLIRHDDVNLNKKLAVGLLEMFMKHCYRMNELSSRLVGTLKTETGFCMKQTF